ncbi:hypothetical protein [Sulfurimonas sp. HSL-1716]|uniref:hypothetical protein n=1 Tax=Hydrocurvibacter sulfurireducens TaxID=3131937 RepID=UPI0031FA2372
MWLNEFKVAIVTKDTKKINSLMASMPQFEELAEMEEAFYLFQQADKLLNELKDETAKTMKKLRDNISFIESTYTKNTSKLDIMQ